MKHYFSLAVDSNISLVQPTLYMAEEIYVLLDSDRERFREFLDFLDYTNESEDERKYIASKLSGYAQETDRLFFIAYEGKLVGCIDLHFIDMKHKKAEIGYWLHSSQTGKGIMTKVVRRVSQIAFEEMGLNKLTIVADVENTPSNAVARNSGFSFVGTDRSDILMYGEFRDLNRYALLKDEIIF